MQARAVRGCAIFTLALMAGASSCDDPVQACTLIGCIDGLEIVLTGSVPDSVTVEATASGGETRTAECVRSDGCVYVAFEGFHPEEVTVRVAWDSGTIAVTLEPAYTVSQPNGPDCPPICRYSRVVIDF
jgi:hypothetical protein